MKIERIARRLKQSNKYVANAIGHDGLAKKLSLAGVLHSENPLAVEADWIDEYNLKSGDYDVTKVDPELCETIPTATQMGKDSPPLRGGGVEGWIREREKIHCQVL